MEELFINLAVANFPQATQWVNVLSINNKERLK